MSKYKRRPIARIVQTILCRNTQRWITAALWWKNVQSKQTIGWKCAVSRVNFVLTLFPARTDRIFKNKSKFSIASHFSRFIPFFSLIQSIYANDKMKFVQNGKKSVLFSSWWWPSSVLVDNFPDFIHSIIGGIHCYCLTMRSFNVFFCNAIGPENFPFIHFGSLSVFFCSFQIYFDKTPSNYRMSIVHRWWAVIIWCVERDFLILKSGVELYKKHVCFLHYKCVPFIHSFLLLFLSFHFASTIRMCSVCG